MASGIKLGSSFRLTSPVPTLANATFAGAADRLAAGQLRHTAWDYHEQGTGTYWRIKPVAQCFGADGTTPATQAGTWGTLAAHWVSGSGGAGQQGPIGLTGAPGAPGAASTVPGPVGTNGRDGATIRHFAAAPAPTDGNVGDTGINDVTSDQYEKTAATTWTFRGNNKGVKGDTGPIGLTGATGATGAPGSGSTGTAGVTTFNTRSGPVVLTAPDVLSVVSRANQLAGGLQSASNLAAMKAIPDSLRDYGMTVVVYADPVTAYNGRYDLANDRVNFIKQGVDVAGQFPAYTAVALYSTTSGYVTYPDPVSLALRIFHSLAPAPASAQPTPVNASNVLNAAWEEISPSAATVRVPLYTAPGTNFDGAMTQLATTTALNTRFNNRGAWATGQVYQPNDAVSYNGATYYRTGATFTSLAAFDFKNWSALATAAVIANTFTAGIVKIGPGITAAPDGTISAALLYSTTGLAPDGAMTQQATTNTTGVLSNLTTTSKTTLVDAINEIKIASGKAAILALGAVHSANGFSGGILTSYPTYEIAESMSVVGQEITLLGYHEAINVNKSVVISGGTVGSAVIGYSASGITTRIQGLCGMGRFVVCPGVSANNTIEFVNLVTGPDFFFESFCFATTTYKAVVIVVNCRVHNAAAYSAQSNRSQGLGVMHFQEQSASSQWTFRNCDLRSDNNAIFTGFPVAATRVTLEANTTLTPGLGRSNQETSVADSNVLTADSSFFIDNRPSAAGDTLAPLPYPAGGSIVVDFAAASVRTIAANGALAYGASLNVAPLKTKQHFINNIAGSDIALSFPLNWKFAPARPTTLAASKEAVLTLTSLGTDDTTVKAAYAVLT